MEHRGLIELATTATAATHRRSILSTNHIELDFIVVDSMLQIASNIIHRLILPGARTCLLSLSLQLTPECPQDVASPMFRQTGPSLGATPKCYISNPWPTAHPSLLSNTKAPTMQPPGFVGATTHIS